MKRPALYMVREPEAAAASNVLHINSVRLRGAADARPIGRPWPRQHAWRDLVRRLGKNLAPHRGEDR